MQKFRWKLLKNYNLYNSFFWSVADSLNIGNIPTNFIQKIKGLNKFRITCVQIHITDQCNLDCKYCYAKNHLGDPLLLKEIIKLIHDCKKLKVHEIQLVGGEPFLYKHIKVLIEYASKLNLIIRIFTNATQINNGWIKYLKKFKNIILVVKFDSIKGYRKHLGKNIYQKTIKIIKSLTDNGIKTNTFISVTKNNFSDVEKLIEKSFKMKTIPIVERYLPTCNSNINDELEINAEEWLDVLNKYEKYNQTNLQKYKLISKMLNFYCSCYTSTLSIDTNGEALPCPFAPKTLSLGNIKKKKISEIFNIYKNKLAEWNAIPDTCKGCKEVSICKGGCKTYSFLKYDQFGKKDPLCKGIPPNKTMSSFNHFLFQ